MPGRNRVVRRERELVAVGDWTVDIETTDRIRPVQDNHRNLRFRALFEQVAKCGDVSEKAHAYVLNVIHERIEIFELLGLRAATLTIERINRKPGGFVFRIR